MKYIDEYRDPAKAREYAEALKRVTTRSWRIMEVCGGQTHAIVRFGVDKLLPEQIELIHGPGCPVCVTPLGKIDQALAIATRPEVIFCSFGDMLRVPGSEKDLLRIKSEGGDVRIVYSPLDALELAKANPDREVVFFAVGFETTAPANAMAAHQAKLLGIKNFSLLASHVLVPPALKALVADDECLVDAFLAAGHVCAIMGTGEYLPLAESCQVPIVVTGFEPLDILQGVLMCVRQLEEGRHEVENQYSRAVRPEGNPAAQAIVSEVFRSGDRPWRGLGMIPESGLHFREEYANFDAVKRFGVGHITAEESPDCLSGKVLQGVLKPDQCPAFGKKCTPEMPLGATMVSNEGACAAYYRYRRLESE
jgi:hydrogenase expression/formation protein HypD